MKTKLIAAFVISLMTWTHFGCGGGEATSTTLGDDFSLSDFNGNYKHKDDNCVSDSGIIEEFNVNDGENDNLIVVDPGSSAATEGDFFVLEEGVSQGVRTISSNALGCLAFLIPDHETSENIEEDFQIQAEVGDLFALCPDESSDRACEITYIRTSFD